MGTCVQQRDVRSSAAFLHAVLFDVPGKLEQPEEIHISAGRANLCRGRERVGEIPCWGLNWGRSPTLRQQSNPLKQTTLSYKKKNKIKEKKECQVAASPARLQEHQRELDSGRKRKRWDKVVVVGVE